MNKQIIEASGGFEIEVIERGRYTMVSLRNGDKIMSVGIARTGSGDKTNSKKGKSIALGRARRAWYLKMAGGRLQNPLMG